VLAALPLLSCKALRDGAREEFSTRFSCPPERIELRPRPDLHPYDVVFGPGASPPVEVASDPARLAIWQRTQSANRDGWDDGREVFELRGCEHAVLFACNHPSDPDGSTYPGVVSCSTGKYPPGTKPSW
jgi:hypothetical protein